MSETNNNDTAEIGVLIPADKWLEIVRLAMGQGRALYECECSMCRMGRLVLEADASGQCIAPTQPCLSGSHPRSDK